MKLNVLEMAHLVGDVRACRPSI